MKTIKEIAHEYLTNEMKKKTISKQDKALLKQTLVYLKANEAKEKEEWQQFRMRATNKKEEWFAQVAVEGVAYDLAAIERKEFCCLAMYIKVGLYKTFLFELNVACHSNRNITFHTSLNGDDEVALPTYDAAEECISELLQSQACKTYVENVKASILCD